MENWNNGEQTWLTETISSFFSSLKHSVFPLLFRSSHASVNVVLFCTLVAVFAFFNPENHSSLLSHSLKSSITTFYFLKDHAEITEAHLKDCRDILMDGCTKICHINKWLIHSTHAGCNNWNWRARTRRTEQMISCCCLTVLLYHYS